VILRAPLEPQPGEENSTVINNSWGALQFRKDIL